MRRLVLFYAVLAVLTMVSMAVADVPNLMSYQGQLTNSSGDALDTTVSMVFVIYDDSTGGTALWTETQPSVTTTGGQFNVDLGSVSALNHDLFTSDARWLGITVGSDPELLPRTRLVSYAYGFHALRSDTAAFAWSIADDSVTTTKLGNNAVITSKIAPNAVTTAEIAPNAVTNNELANDAVTSPEILDGSIGFMDIGQNGATVGQVMKWNGTNWIAANDSLGGGGSFWNLVGAVLYTNNWWAVAKGAAGNQLHGAQDFTHVNLGDNSQTGQPGMNYAGATVSGGSGNVASHDYTTVAGGMQNHATFQGGAVGGGSNNFAMGDHNVISGGQMNNTGNSHSTIGGGIMNNASGQISTIAGGSENQAPGDYTTIGGGRFNLIFGQSSTIGGGQSHFIDNDYGFVGGGLADSILPLGSGNPIGAVIGGGYYNRAGGEKASVLGGESNTAFHDWSTVGGGKSNTAGQTAATVAGGEDNTINAPHAAIGGGQINTIAINGDWSVIPGGQENTITSQYSVIAGGFANGVDATFSAVAGGDLNVVQPMADHNLLYGMMVDAVNPFQVQFFEAMNFGALKINRDDLDGPALGPITVGTNPGNGNGAFLTWGGVWTNTCARDKKENFQPVDGRQLLQRIADMPIESWYYKGTTERHIGPVAEDFVGAFDVGITDADGTRHDKHLSSADVAGVALIGIQELYRMTTELEQKTQRIDDLEQRLADLEAAVQNLQAGQD